VIVADVSGSNGNVMLELGVAAAWHKKDKVIIIRQTNPSDHFLFDIGPARHIEYSCTPQGFTRLYEQLRVTIHDAIAGSPFEDLGAGQVEAPFRASLDDAASYEGLLTPGMAHRRFIPGRFLEFGSLYNFRFGWLTVGDLQLRNVEVKAELCFSRLLTSSEKWQPWLGVAVRSQGYLANMEHLAYLRANGGVFVTLEEDGGQSHIDYEVDSLDDFDPLSAAPVPFHIAFNEKEWMVRVGSVEWARPVEELPHVFSHGRILVLGFACWVGLRSLEVNAL
jgi:hypothetical protein